MIKSALLSFVSKVGAVHLEEVSTVRGSGWVNDRGAKSLLILDPIA
jgi:hypothetical protein